MSRLTVHDRTQSNQTALDHGITDLLVHDTGTVTVLFATSGETGGVSVYLVGPDGALDLIDFVLFDAAYAEDALPGLSVIETADGPQLVVAAGSGGCLTTFDIGPDGRLGAMREVHGLNGPADGVVRDLDPWRDEMLFLANDGDGAIRGYGMDDAGGLIDQLSVTDTATTYAQSVFAIEMVTLGGRDFLIGACNAESGVTAYRVGAGDLIATGSLGAAEGLGVMVPTVMETAMIGGRCFVLLGSAPGDGIGQSGAITVMELLPDGRLVPTDHVIDTLATRFGTIQSLEVVEANGFTYVIAGGGDDGLTLFVLMPNGRLQLLDVIADTFTGGLENVTAITAFEGVAGVHLFLSSEIGAGLTEVRLDTTGNGSTLVAAGTGDALTGTAGNDILLGGAGADRLEGRGGDDILEDGGGDDTLVGGAGRDIFTLRSDGTLDVIVDFEPGRDRLDLSDWPFFYDPAGLTIQPTTDGAIVTWRGETLILVTANGTSLSAAAVRAAVLQAPNRPPSMTDPPGADPVDSTATGTSGDDTLVGGPWNDVIDGLDGADMLIGNGGTDTLNGNAGSDVAQGGDGNDSLNGGAGWDSLNGGTGADTLSGMDGFDVLEGGDGDDQLAGNNGNDTLSGDAGNDTLNGGLGADALFGGAGDDNLSGLQGFDVLDGGDGDDLLKGNAGNDTLSGGAGNDTLSGGIGWDSLDGGADDDAIDGLDGFDTLLGAAGNDTLNGNAGNDSLDGGAGNDTLDGGIGADTLAGGTGHDALGGAQGFDLLFGDRGNDRLLGNAGNDTLDGGEGNDTLTGGLGADVFVFASGTDLVADFQNDLDALHLEDALWGGGQISASGIWQQFGSEVGGALVFDFGNGNVLTVQGLGSVQQLLDDIVIV